jgi:predicted nucleotidyltransferase
MELYKQKFTKLEHNILNYLFIYPTAVFTGLDLAKKLDVSPTAIAKSLVSLQKNNLITVKKDKRLSIKLNRENEKVFNLKRVFNLLQIYESGVIDLLTDQFQSTAIILFGSYSRGDDTENSDIDIAIISSKEKEVDLSLFEKRLYRSINLHFFLDINKTPSELKESIINGIVLKGSVEI